MTSWGWRTAITVTTSNPLTRRLEPQTGQHRYGRVLDDHERRGRQRGEIRPDLGDGGGFLFGVERTFLLQAT
jgi:hypothetical protein